VLGHTFVREDERGKKGGGGCDGAPFIGDPTGGGGRAMGGAMRWQGLGGGHGASVAVGRCSVAWPAVAHL
jgi:hypothetical protein